ncbi:MAG: Hsp33 family molecular chaperone HslO [Kiritimatiellae bacterium]|nr:Hsp33 family molecular chaperone HslO [Kiritimatiellia bacterium]
MRDCREEWYDPEKRVVVSIADVTSATRDLVRGHLCGPTAAHYLAKALAAVSLLGAETEDETETVVLQMKCTGPLGGFVTECAGGGTLRGYTEKKTLDDFDGLGAPSDRKVLGETRIQVVRSLPGKILSQGVAESIGRYLSESLQRKAAMWLEASVSDELEILEARGVMAEAMPDGDYVVEGRELSGLGRASRTILKELGLGKAELRKMVPLSFGCRCSPERAMATLAALSADEAAALPETLDVTCHMCGRTYTVRPHGCGGTGQ